MPWMIPAAIIGSSLLGSSAASSAASTQANAANNAANLQNQQYQQTRQDQMPWMQAGQTALNALTPLVMNYRPFDMNTFAQDPGYQFRMDQGTKALERSAAARGGLISGNTGGALQNYGQGLASQEYQNAFNRYQAERQAQLGPLQSLAGVGQTTAQQLGTAGQNYATNAGNMLTSGAAAQAAGYMGGANAVGQSVGQYLNYNQGNNLVSALRGNGRYTPGQTSASVWDSSAGEF